MNEQEFKKRERKYLGKFSSDKIFNYYHKPLLGLAKQIRDLKKFKTGGKDIPTRSQVNGTILKLQELQKVLRRIEYKTKKELSGVNLK